MEPTKKVQQSETIHNVKVSEKKESKDMNVPQRTQRVGMKRINATLDVKNMTQREYESLVEDPSKK